MISRFCVGSAAVAAAFLLLPCAAHAQPNFTLKVNGGPEFNWQDPDGGSLNGLGQWNIPGNESVWEGWNYTGELDDGVWHIEWSIVFNDDGAALQDSAFVTANIVVTNSDPNTQNFTLLMTQPVTTPIVDPIERGSIVGTLTDNNFDGATVWAPAGSQIYTPRIDALDEVPGFLMQEPFQQSAGPLESVPVGPQDFGIPTWVPATQDVDTSIAIFLSFDLTGGDSASFTSIFEVAIPGVGGLPLLAVFALLGGRRRR
jgi:hypothetical protein